MKLGVSVLVAIELLVVKLPPHEALDDFVCSRTLRRIHVKTVADNVGNNRREVVHGGEFEFLNKTQFLHA